MILPCTADHDAHEKAVNSDDESDEEIDKVGRDIKSKENLANGKGGDGPAAVDNTEVSNHRDTPTFQTKSQPVSTYSFQIMWSVYLTPHDSAIIFL